MLMGCQHFQRAGECRALADGVNPELKEISNMIDQRGPVSSDQYRVASNLYARAAKRLQNLRFKDAELAKFAKDLSDNLAGVGRSCDRLSSSSGTTAQGVDSSAQREFEGFVQRHHLTVAAIEHRCAE